MIEPTQDCGNSSALAMKLPLSYLKATDIWFISVMYILKYTYMAFSSYKMLLHNEIIELSYLVKHDISCSNYWPFLCSDLSHGFWFMQIFDMIWIWICDKYNTCQCISWSQYCNYWCPGDQLIRCQQSWFLQADIALVYYFNTLRPRQNGRQFPDDFFKCIFFSCMIMFNFDFPEVFAEVCSQESAKPLCEPMMVSLLTHICVTEPQWVNWLAPSDAIWQQRNWST